jgi:mono/diheme cytochrome c family protein
MTRISKFALCSLVVGALALCSTVAQAQDLAKRGKSLFNTRGCNACHTVGKPGKNTAAGPDLAGVTERRSADWLKRWLKDPSTMIGSDSVVDAMVVASKNVKMPNMKLSEPDIAALLSYLAENKKTM